MNSYNKECNYKSWVCVVVITIIAVVVVVFKMFSFHQLNPTRALSTFSV